MGASIALGIDLGTTFVAAAASRSGGAPTPVELGESRPAMPSTVYLRDDGTLLVGEAAERRSRTEPARVAREYKRRLGDPVPLVIAGTPFGADALLAAVLTEVVRRAEEREGTTASAVAVTHPASWSTYKLDLLRQAIRQADLTAELVPEPVAAAVHYATLERVDPGTVVAVYDFGGGTFDAAVLRRTVDGFELLGQPEGLERLGGIDIDQAVVAHVDRVLDGRVLSLDAADPTAMAALARLRAECRTAKEALSSDTEAVIPVTLPGLHQDVRLTRAELESMIRPRLGETVAALQRAVRSAGLAFGDVSRILLVGGTSRIPLVAEVVREETGRPVVVDADPKLAVAMGAASWAAGRPAEAEAPTVGVVAVPPVPPVPPVPAAPGPPPPGAGTSGESRGEPAPKAAGGSRRGRAVLAAVVVGAIAVAGTAFVLAADGGGDGDAAEPSSTTSASSTVPTSSGATSVPTTPATTSPEPPTTAAPGPAPTPCPTDQAQTVCILDVGVDPDGGLVASYVTSGYTPELEPVEDHIHFYFDAVGDPVNAGSEGTGGDWRLWDAPNPFTATGGESGRIGYTLSDARAVGATQLCALVATPTHAVIPGTGNCIELPAP